jgi:hypothetical protein
VIGTSVFRIGLLLLMLLLAGCEKHRLDEQVKELCAKDGGVKVYEVVRMPRSEFTEFGLPLEFRPSRGEQALGPDYLFRVDRSYYRADSPEMSRSHYTVVRRSDNKVLGETVIYGRGGGDIPSPMHESSSFCPPLNEADVDTLLKSVFRPM